MPRLSISRKPEGNTFKYELVLNGLSDGFLEEDPNGKIFYYQVCGKLEEIRKTPPSENDIEDLGRYIFDHFPDQIKDKLKDLDPSTRLELEITTNKPEVVEIPWEIIAFGNSYPLQKCKLNRVTRINDAGMVSSRMDFPGRILVVAPNYGELPATRRILEGIQKQFSNNVIPLVSAEATKNKIQKHLQSGVDVIYFICHTDAGREEIREPALQLFGGEQLYITEWLCDEIKRVERPRLLFFNVCGNRLMQSALVNLRKVGVQACIGAFCMTSDKDGASLTIEFSRVLAEGRSIIEAFLTAKTNCLSDNIPRENRADKHNLAVFILEGTDELKEKLIPKVEDTEAGKPAVIECELKDQNGRPLAKRELVFEITNPENKQILTLNAKTDDDGEIRKEVSGEHTRKAGEYKVITKMDGRILNESSFNVCAGPPKNLEIKFA